MHDPRDKSALQNLVNMQIAVELTRRNQKLFPVQWIAADIAGKHRITADYSSTVSSRPFAEISGTSQFPLETLASPRNYFEEGFSWSNNAL